MKLEASLEAIITDRPGPQADGLMVNNVAPPPSWIVLGVDGASLQQTATANDPGAYTPLQTPRSYSQFITFKYARNFADFGHELQERSFFQAASGTYLSTDLL